MVKLFTAVYVILFSIIANCFLLFDSTALIVLSILAFVLFNFVCCIWVSRSESIRLRILCHGNVLLISFYVSLVVSAALHILAYLQIIGCGKSAFIHSIICCVICNFVIFWNGILCVYLTSVQLGIKIRVIGLICGLIPGVNLIVLLIIISKTYTEFFCEREKERLNADRKYDKVCKTKYPILLVHGVFFRDSKLLNYWGRIPRELERNGAVCFYGNHQSAAAVKDSAKELSKRIKEIADKTGCEKVNIIAHSKGGLDCRYAIANCGMSEYVASLTTINTPHRGCLFAEWLFEKIPEAMKEKIARHYNNAAKFLGDETPDFIAAVTDLKADVCIKFDRETPTPENIYCQSVGSVMQKARHGKFPLNLCYDFVKHFDGKNDGLVGVDSFEWGSKYILLDYPLKRGISHADMIDLNRENIKGFDVREFYVKLVSDLRERGL